MTSYRYVLTDKCLTEPTDPVSDATGHFCKPASWRGLAYTALSLKWKRYAWELWLVLRTRIVPIVFARLKAYYHYRSLRADGCGCMHYFASCHYLFLVWPHIYDAGGQMCVTIAPLSRTFSSGGVLCFIEELLFQSCTAGCGYRYGQDSHPTSSGFTLNVVIWGVSRQSRSFISSLARSLSAYSQLAALVNTSTSESANNFSRCCVRLVHRRDSSC